MAFRVHFLDFLDHLVAACDLGWDRGAICDPRFIYWPVALVFSSGRLFLEAQRPQGGFLLVSPAGWSIGLGVSGMAEVLDFLGISVESGLRFAVESASGSCNGSNDRRMGAEFSSHLDEYRFSPVDSRARPKLAK